MKSLTDSIQNADERASRESHSTRNTPSVKKLLDENAWSVREQQIVEQSDGDFENSGGTVLCVAVFSKFLGDFVLTVGHPQGLHFKFVSKEAT